MKWNNEKLMKKKKNKARAIKRKYSQSERGKLKKHEGYVKRRANLSEEAKEEINNNKLGRYHAQPEDIKKKKIAVSNAAAKVRRDNETPVERETRLQGHKDYKKIIPVEEKKAMNLRGAANRKRKIASENDEERRIRLDKSNASLRAWRAKIANNETEAERRRRLYLINEKFREKSKKNKNNDKDKDKNNKK